MQARIDGSAPAGRGGRGLACAATGPSSGFEKLFCADCGSQLFSRNPADARPDEHSARRLRRRPRRAPEWRQFVAYAAAWEPIPDDGLPRYDESSRASRPSDRAARRHARHRRAQRATWPPRCRSTTHATPSWPPAGGSRRSPARCRARTAQDRLGPGRRRRSSAGDPPPEVNPSLWRQARLNAEHGLFEVRDGVYQVRGADISNITFVAGEKGWIVVDALTTAETARAALALVTEHLGERPVERGDLHPQPHRPLRRPARDRDRRGPGERPADHRARRLPRRRRARERDRRAGHGPPGRVHVRRPAAARPARARGRRHRRDRAAAARPVWWRPPSRSPRRARCSRSTACTVEFQLTPDTEAPAEMNFLFVEQRGALHGRELLGHAPQPLHAARRGGPRRARLEQVHHRGHRAASAAAST